MRLIFVDEAGTSDAREEKCRIVAGVIANADRHLTMAEVAIKGALQAVPPEFRDGFIFHAEDIMNNDRYRERWRLTDRVNLLKSMMSVPRKMGMAISFGQIWKASTPTPMLEMLKLSPAQEHHLLAFNLCVSKADQFIRDHGAHDEIGMLICENSDMRKFLALAPEVLRKDPIVFAPDMLNPRRKDEEQGYNSQNGVERVERIRETVHFVGKGDDKMVWLADACAYGLKRYFAGADFGNDFCDAILGARPDLYDFRGPLSGGLYWFGK